MDKLRKRRKEAWERANQITQGAIAAGRQLTDEEQKELASLRVEMHGIDKLLAEQTANDDYAASLDADVQPAIDPPRPASQAGQPSVGAQVPPAAQAGAQRPGVPRVDVVASSRDHLPFRSLGEQAQAILKCTKYHAEPDPRLDIIHKAAAQGLNTVVPSDGGYLIQQDFAGELREHVFAENAWMSSIDRIPVGQGKNGIVLPYAKDHDESGGSVSAGIQVYLRDEAAAYTKSKPQIGRMEISLREYVGLAYTTIEMEEDAPALGAYLRKGFKRQLSYKISKDVVNGDGAAGPLGFTNAQNGSLLVVAKKGGQAADTIIFENVNKMNTYVVDDDGAVWLAGLDTIEQLPFMKLDVGTGGSAVFLPAGGLTGKPHATLYAKPIYKNPFAPLLGDQGDILLFKPSEYIWIDKGEPLFEVSMHLRFDFGENALRLTYRANGRPGWTAKKKLQSGLECSPFVALQTR